MALLIDAFERQEVGTKDVPGAYLYADTDDFTILKMTGESVDIMCKTNPVFKEFVMKKRETCTISAALKALYGCIRLAMLWCNLFVVMLEKLHF